jgi:hypothetical protein
MKTTSAIDEARGLIVLELAKLHEEHGPWIESADTASGLTCGLEDAARVLQRAAYAVRSRLQARTGSGEETATSQAEVERVRCYDRLASAMQWLAGAARAANRDGDLDDAELRAREALRLLKEARD